MYGGILLFPTCMITRVNMVHNNVNMRLIFVNMQHNSSRMFTYLSRICWHNYIYVAYWHTCNLSCMKGAEVCHHAYGFLAWRDLYRATSAVTRDFGFRCLIQKTAPPPPPHQIVSPIWRIAFELKHWYMYSYLIKKIRSTMSYFCISWHVNVISGDVGVMNNVGSLDIKKWPCIKYQWIKSYT